MRPLHLTALVLAVIGALNWGLVGLFQFDLVASIFGGMDAPAARAVYVLVGLAGATLLATSFGRHEGATMPSRPSTAAH